MTSRCSLVAGAAALVLVACTAPSSAPIAVPEGEGAKANSASGGAASSADQDDTASPTSPASVDPKTCAAKGDADACFECCAAGDETAFAEADDTFLACICSTPGVCKTDCGSDLCVDPSKAPSAACAECLDQNGQACDDKAADACDAAAKCKAASACVSAARCGASQ